ncbi:MAG: hypothetical protein MI739_01665, partial [Bacteroidales bacterium]|nr:hypothetical protein [Bacteroidales bacterium]
PNVKVGSILDIQFSEEGLVSKWCFHHDIPVKYTGIELEQNPYIDYNNVILITEISSKSEITRLIIVQYYNTGCNPEFAFEKEQIKMLAKIDADIDMDIYCLSED